MVYNFIKTAIQGHVFTLTLDRESKRNAFTPTFVNEVAHAIKQVNSLTQIKLFVLRANGPVFCAGMDLLVYQNPELDEVNQNIENKDISLAEVMDSLEKPSIAILEGDVIAGGFMFILGCTYVYAKKGVQFKLPEIALGIFPFQVMAGLLRILPEKKVLQICLDPKSFSLQQAIEYGIVDGIFQEQELSTWIEDFADKSTQAIQAGMRALKDLRHIDESLRYSYLLKSLASLKDDPEVKRRMSKFQK